MIPKGYKLVPVEPTEEMIEAAGSSPMMLIINGILSLHQARGHPIEGLGNHWKDSALANAYREMLKAAPSAEPPTST